MGFSFVPARDDVTVSIVSHGHGAHLNLLLSDIAKFSSIQQIIVTLNVPESDINIPESLIEQCLLVHNDSPKGFGANHNAAAQMSNTKYFTVLNPDIRLSNDIFPTMLEEMREFNLSFVAPSIVNSDGNLEDSMRYFPTLLGLVQRFLGWNRGVYPVGAGSTSAEPDWIAGMFMLFERSKFASISGFDESFFLYCEDVDICYRLRASGHNFRLLTSVSAIHDAQRSSHRTARFFWLHIQSLARLFAKHPKLLLPLSHQRVGRGVWNAQRL